MDILGKFYIKLAFGITSVSIGASASYMNHRDTQAESERFFLRFEALSFTEEISTKNYDEMRV